MLLPDTDEAGARRVALRILEAIRKIELDFGNGRTAKFTVSIGGATVLVTARNMNSDLIDMADQAMYASKQSGRDRYSEFLR